MIGRSAGATQSHKKTWGSHQKSHHNQLCHMTATVPSVVTQGIRTANALARRLFRGTRLNREEPRRLEARREWLLSLSADQRIVSPDFFRAILAEYERRDVVAASVLGPFVGQRWWQIWWFRPIAENPVLLGSIFLLQRLRSDATWLIGALAMRRETYKAVGGAAAAASYGAGVFDDWGWTRVFETRCLRTAMVYHSALEDISNWQSFADCWDGLSRWAAGILTCRKGAWLGALILTFLVSAFSIATVKVLVDLRIIDPACGSGSFLIGVYQYLDWHRDRYVAEGPSKHTKECRALPCLYFSVLRSSSARRSVGSSPRAVCISPHQLDPLSA